MRKAPVKSASFKETLAKRDKLLHALGQLLQEATTLWSQIHTLVEATSKREDPDLLTLQKESSAYLKEFHRISDFANKIKHPLEQKLNELKRKGPSTLPKPVPAKSFQTIVMLHLVGDQAMGKRLEELNEIEKRQKDILHQFEMGLKMCQERFDEIVSRLNLLLFMKDCIEKDGSLPLNILYMTRIPQAVTSPFAHLPELSKLLPQGQAAQMPTAQHRMAHDPERVKEEMEKRRKLLLHLREQAQLQAEKEKNKIP